MVDRRHLIKSENTTKNKKKTFWLFPEGIPDRQRRFGCSVG